MSTIGDILDQAQEFLHDDGDVWPRTELLNWANDGYRQLLAQSHAVVRPFQIDVPGRTAWSGTQEWEDRHGEGTWRKFTTFARSAQIACTFRWEAQAIEGIEPEDSEYACTQLWEVVHLSSHDHHMRLVLSKQHERPLKVYHDDKRLIGASTRELDTLETEWWQQTGDPIFWFPSEGGRDGSYEIYEIDSTYVQGYHQTEETADTPVGLGMPRLLSGSRSYAVDSQVDRWDYAYSGSGDPLAGLGLGYKFTSLDTENEIDATFSWELDDDYGDGTESEDTVMTQPWEVAYDSTLDEQFLGVGLIRSISSPDRQYMAAPYANAEFSSLGIARDFKSGDDAVTIWEIIVAPDALTESDGLSLVPPRMAKYIKFYVLSRAFSRKGRGFRPDMAQHFTSLFQMGVALLTRIGNLGFVDRDYTREEVTPMRGFRPPFVQLPPEFERWR